MEVTDADSPWPDARADLARSDQFDDFAFLCLSAALDV